MVYLKAQLQILSNQSTMHGALHAGKAVRAVFESYKSGDDQQEQVMEAGRLFTCRPGSDAAAAGLHRGKLT